MNISDRLRAILEKDQAWDACVKSIITTTFDPILKDNKLFFFEEYTDHGIDHVEKVLEAVEFLIPEDSFGYINPKEVAILILAVVLHDIGMHTEFATFKAMIEGKYDDVRVAILDDKTWAELWEDYLSESRHWSSKKVEEIFGSHGLILRTPDLSNKDELTGADKKFIGEFIRRNHARLAHEIALKGIVAGDTTMPLGDNDILDEQDRGFVGIVARSHGMEIRNTFDYLEEIAYGVWKNPEDMNIVFLMVLLRIADYLQIDKKRTNQKLLKLKRFNSPISLREHEAHLAIKTLTFNNQDPELIYVNCNPSDAQMYVKIQGLIRDIQQELDLSWAVLGEVYGFLPNGRPKIKFRRINSNLEHHLFLKQIDYVPQKIAFEINNELSKLLIAPLYGNNPTYGVRELVQNATDACKERMKLERDRGWNTYYEPLVTVSVDKKEEGKIQFKIKDNGKGMTLDEIINYFLSVGSSFRNTVEWKKDFASGGKSEVKRNGKFGIGVLAAFLLGDEISVKTKSAKEGAKAFAFTAAMDSKFIDIKTINDFEAGTEICIQMSEAAYRKMEKRGTSDYEIFWTDWYIGEEPKVQYFLNGREIEPKKNIAAPQWREFRTDHYEKIRWEYSNFRKNKMFVACNDIIVTRDNYSTFHYGYSEVIQSKPHILISDSQGILPLSLSRNSLESLELPFDKELYESVCLDFITRILMLTVSSEKVKKYSLSPHSADLLFLCNGFSLDINYFVDRMNGKKILRVLTRSLDVIENGLIFLSCSDDFVLYPQYNTLYGLRGQKERVVPDTKAHILLLKERYVDYFELPKRIPQWLKYKHTKIWESANYVAYTMNGFQSQLALFQEKEFSKMADRVDKNIQSIQELPMSYLEERAKKAGGILEGLLEKYIGNNVVIPYDMEERKRLYPLAFEELKEYMKFYEASK